MTSFWPEEYADLDFDLPEDLIAQEPVVPADHARLMVIERKSGAITHDHFYSLGKYLSSLDSIFYNATRVEERRAYLKKPDADKLFECVFLKATPTGWQVLMRNIRRLKDGVTLVAAKDSAYKFVLHRRGEQVFLESSQSLSATDFARIGEMPIPPYMRRAAAPADSETYQNFFKEQIAQKEKVQGSAASPTAALHFTPGLHEMLRTQGLEFHPVCLDIGYGTFAPLTRENFTQGKLHAEHYYIPPATAECLSSTGRKIALGTTALRALLSFQKYAVAEGESEIFITPKDNITGVDGLITNFHLPRSSLILLTAAFCGRKLLAQAYREAIQHGYRFYSYGDAMLII